MRSAADVSESWSGKRRAPSRPGLLTVALVFLAVVLMLGLVGLSASEGLLAWDVRFAYLPAAEAVLDGVSPYPELDDPILEDQKGYVYPPQLLIALLVLTLHVLGIRDARCYAAALLWVPSISGVLLANVSIPLAFALAVMWRYRDEVWPPALALGLAVSAKLLLWPMFVWMLATRRLRAMVLAVAIGLGVTLGAWAAIGFDGFGTYPDLLRRPRDSSARAGTRAPPHGIARTLRCS